MRVHVFSSLARCAASAACAAAMFLTPLAAWAGGGVAMVQAGSPRADGTAARRGVARLSGQVQDAMGAIIPGAQIRILRANGEVVASAKSDAAGQFHMPAPPAGSYTLTVVEDGFDPLVRTVQLPGVGTSGLTLVMQVASVAQTVTVKAADAAEIVAPDQNRDTPTISSKDMKTLPVLDNDPLATLEALLDAGATGEGGPTLMVDGVEMKSIGVAPSAIERISINEDPYSAEFRQPGRGQVEVVTKSTADRFHGAVTWTFRDSSMEATNYFAKTKAPEQRRNYEGFLTGPVGRLKDTSFLYSMDRREQNSYYQVNATTPQGVVNQSVEAPYRRTNLTMKVSHQVNDHHSIFAMYRFFDSSRANANVGGLTLPEAGYTARYFDMDLTFHDDLIISPTKLNQFNILFERNIDRTTSATNAPAIEVNGAFRGGGAQNDTLQTENNPNISDIVSWTAKKIHQLKFGVQLPNLGRRVLEDYADRQGTYTFASLSAFEQKQPETFSIQQGQARFVTHYDQPGAFFLDQIQVTPRLTVTPGVRYDFQNALPGTMDAVEPRLSFAYALDPAKGMVVRVGAGTYMRRVGANVGQLLARYQYAAERSLLLTTDLCYPDITQCNALSAQPPNIFNFEPGLNAPMQAYFGMSVERQVTKASTVTVGYNGYRGWHALRSLDVNAPLPPFTSAERPNPNFGQVLEQDSGGYQKSDDLSVTFRGRLSDAFSGYLQYDYSHADSNTEWSTYEPEDSYDPNADWSRSSFDQRHRLNVFGTLYPDKPLTVGFGFYEYSPTPYTETTGTDDFHTGVLNARPDGVPRNSLEGDDQQDLQVRLGYTWKMRPLLRDASPTLQFSVASFNTLNRPNFGGYVGVVTSPDFEQPTTAGSARRVQLGAAYNF